MVVNQQTGGATRFRTRLTIAIMLVVVALTGVAFYFAQRHVATEAQRDLRQDFDGELRALHQAQNLRNAALTERCRALAAKPRIHAALEDNALDLLYPSAKDELRDVMQGEETAETNAGRILHARFYRFLDAAGAILPPPNPKEVGELTPQTEAALVLPKLPETPQIGYIWRGETVDEVVAAPIFSSETGDVISALVAGFKPLRVPSRGLTSGILVDRRIDMPQLSEAARRLTALRTTSAIALVSPVEGNFKIEIDGKPHLLFYTRLNAGSSFPAAYEVCLYSFATYQAWQANLLWRLGLIGAVLLVLAFFVSRTLAARLAAPVQQLEITSEENKAERARAEAALQSTSQELQRTARYSADASHQLKTPLTILRAGLESLLNQADFKPEVYDELGDLLHQTYRLTGVIDDLLLLARMDAGRLQLSGDRVNLNEVVEEWLDDFSAMSDANDLRVKCDLKPGLSIAGERRYTSLIVQNLLENARKYNRSDGKIEIASEVKGGSVVLRIGNSGPGISAEAQSSLFERFHRGANHNGVPGHGLGLNLARDLARLHGGDLRLLRSEDDWTEFEVRFRAARVAISNVTA